MVNIIIRMPTAINIINGHPTANGSSLNISRSEDGTIRTSFWWKRTAAAKWPTWPKAATPTTTPNGCWMEKRWSGRLTGPVIAVMAVGEQKMIFTSCSSTAKHTTSSASPKRNKLCWTKKKRTKIRTKKTRTARKTRIKTMTRKTKKQISRSNRLNSTWPIVKTVSCAWPSTRHS